MELWKNFLEIVRKTSKLSDVTDNDLIELSKHRLNGRQVSGFYYLASLVELTNVTD
jgi:hypothetical protein